MLFGRRYSYASLCLKFQISTCERAYSLRAVWPAEEVGVCQYILPPKQHFKNRYPIEMEGLRTHFFSILKRVNARNKLYMNNINNASEKLSEKGQYGKTLKFQYLRLGHYMHPIVWYCTLTVHKTPSKFATYEFNLPIGAKSIFNALF